MSLREKLESNRVVAVVVVVLILAGSIALIMRQGRGATYRPGDVYYYDLSTGKLFTASVQAPPIAAPGGGVGVRAQVYACGQCMDASRFIAYLEQYTDDAKAAIREGRNDVDRIEKGHELAAESQTPKWVSVDSPEGRALMQHAEKRCGGGGQQQCLP